MTKPSSSKEHESNCKDRLSELPDELLLHILSFLPIKYAVRTVLLRRFGNLWTMVRKLEFDADAEFNNNVIKYHRSCTIDQFKFSAADYCKRDVSQEDLFEWVNFALGKNTKTLIYDDYDGQVSKEKILPPLTYTSQCLVSLDISCLAVKLTGPVNMGSLRKLKLYRVFMSNETFGDLISGCPCLQELIVILPYGFGKLHFTNPSLEKLVLNLCVKLEEKAAMHAKKHISLDCPNLKVLHVEEVRLKNLQLIDVSSVHEVRIYKCCRFRDKADDFDVLLEKFLNAKVLLLGEYHVPMKSVKLSRLGHKAYLQLGPCGNEALSFRNNAWMHLALRSETRGSCLLDICRLLRSSQFLKRLILYADADLVCNCDMLLHELSSPCVMPRLKTVYVRDYVKPCQGLLQLIEFLLKSAVDLHKLVIDCTMKDEHAEFKLQLQSFPKASRNARVVFA